MGQIGLMISLSHPSYWSHQSHSFWLDCQAEKALFLILGHFQPATAEIQKIKFRGLLGTLKDFGRQAIVDEAPFAVRFHQSRGTQDAQMVRDRHDADIQLGGDLADVLGTVTQATDDAQPRRIAQRLQTLGTGPWLQRIFCHKRMPR